MDIATKRLILAVTVAVLNCGVCRADMVLQFDGLNVGRFVADLSAGWSFTTNQAITVVALAAYDTTGNGPENVRLYDGSGTVLRSATVTNADPTEGLPIPFHTVAISPLALPSGGTYYIAQDINVDSTFINLLVPGLTTDPAITFNGAVSTFGLLGQTPTTINPGAGSSWFGPNFEIESAASVPEPSTLVSAGLAGVIGLCVAWSRRSRKA